MKQPIKHAWLVWVAALCLGIATGGAAQAHGGQPRARGLFTDPVGGGELLAVVSTDLGLHVSRDGGQSWYWICEDATSFDVMDFALAGSPTGDPAARVWLAGGIGLNDDGEVIPGLYASQDGGCNWEPVGGALERQWISALSVHPEAHSEVLAASAHSELPNGVALSQDAGLTWAWTGLADLQEPVTSLLRAPSDPEVVYASTRGGIWRSGDGGRAWTQVALGLLQEDFEEPMLHAVDPDDPQVLWASVSGGRFTVWVSRDGGQSWEELWAVELGSVLSFSVLPGQGPQRRTLVLGRISQADRSLDGGRSWDTYDTPIPVECLVPDPQDAQAAYLCSNPALQIPRPGVIPQAVARTSNQGQGVQPWFSYADTTDHLRCAPQSDICEVCVRLDNPDVTTDPCEGNEPPDMGMESPDLPQSDGGADAEAPAAGGRGEGCGCGQLRPGRGPVAWWGLGLWALLWALGRRRQAWSAQPRTSSER